MFKDFIRLWVRISFGRLFWIVAVQMAWAMVLLFWILAYARTRDPPAWACSAGAWPSWR